MALCLMKRLQMAGNRPIALLGGGTGMIGDPSGRTDMRQMMTKETIQHNIDCFKKQMSRFIDFSDGKADGTGIWEPHVGKSPAFVLCLVRHRKSVMIFPGAWPAAGTALG